MRIFDYLNVSNERSLQGDSGWHVQRNIVTEILKKRNDYHFYLVVPYEQLEVAKANLPRSPLLTLYPYHYSSGSGNKYHFDTQQLWKLLDTWHKDYDIVLNNEILLGSSFRNLFQYKSHFDIPIINYIHWIHTKDVKGYIRSGFMPQHFDMYASIYWNYNTYCNSEYGKKLIMKYASDIFKDDIVETMNQKLHPLPVGFNDKELLEQKTTNRYDKVTLVFNHRVSQYTGYDILLKKCKEIYDKGTKNFQLYITNPAVSVTRTKLDKYPFLVMPEGVLPYKDYLKLLWKSDICFGLHTGDNQWSIAFLEALFCNNIPIVNNYDIFFREMIKDKPHTLDDLEYVIQNIDSIRRPNPHNLERFYWRNLANEYMAVFEKNVEEYGETLKLKNPKESVMLQQVLGLFKQRPIIEKQEILRLRGKITGSGIGLQVPYSRYRRELLKVCDDVIEKENSWYKLKDMSKVNVKPIDTWLE